jgi:HlyD family secretion protein
VRGSLLEHPRNVGRNRGSAWHAVCTPTASNEIPMAHPAVTYAPLVIDQHVRAGAARRRRLLMLAGVLALLAAGIAFFAGGGSKPVQYDVSLVERRTIQQEVEATGQLDVIRRVEVPAPVPGRLIRVLVREGQDVTQGQPLAFLDGRAAVIAARAAQADLDANGGRVAEARAELSAATAALERARRLRERELASDREVEAARATESKASAAVAAAVAERAQARESLRSAKLAESLSSILAPESGIVLRAPEVTGAAVSPEREALFVIGSSLDSLRIVADVAESDVSQVRFGQSANFTVPAYPGRTFTAIVDYVGISARRSAVAVRYPVQLRAENPSRSLLPGMTVTVTIGVARKDGVLAARDAALRFRSEGGSDGNSRASVWRITPHGLDKVRVTAGLSDGAFTELIPEVPGALAVGTELALGVLENGAPRSAGPGIRLGNR